ncbi:hypothetical protein ABTM19_21000, partial [Acinetobacter baumannii]
YARPIDAASNRIACTAIKPVDATIDFAGTPIKIVAHARLFVSQANRPDAQGSRILRGRGRARSTPAGVRFRVYPLPLRDDQA